MSTVPHLWPVTGPAADPVTSATAASAFLAMFSRPAQASMARTYGTVLNPLLAGPFPHGEPLAVLADPDGVGRLQAWLDAHPRCGGPGRFAAGPDVVSAGGGAVRRAQRRVDVA